MENWIASIAKEVNFSVQDQADIISQVRALQAQMGGIGKKVYLEKEKECAWWKNVSIVELKALVISAALAALTAAAVMI